MTATDFKVVGVVGRRDFYNARAEVHVHVFVGNDGDFTIDKGHNDGLAHKVLVTLVVGVYGNSSVAEHGFGTGRGDDHGLIAVSQVITDLPEAALDVSVFNFVISKGRMAAGTPVDDVFAAVDEPVAVQLDKNLAHGTGKAFVHGEAFAAPIAGGTELFELTDNSVTETVLPIPYSFKKLLASKIISGKTFVDSELFLNLYLRCYSGMVGSGNP